MINVLLITPEITPDKGGIQNWMYFVEKLLKFKNYSISHYAYKEDKKLNLLNCYKSNVVILATWKMSFFILPLLLLKDKKIFIFIHGNELLCINSYLKHILSYLVRRKNTFFIANSKAIANMFKDTTNRNIDFIQCPFMEVKSKKQKAKNNINSFFTITRLVKRKNIENVIYAFKKLQNENFPFEYNIAGSGPEIDNLTFLVEKLKLSEEIKFIGQISDEEKKTMYGKSNFFLLPSLFDKASGSIEGYGIVFIEANSYSIPVLSGNTGGMIEAVENNKTGLHCDGSIDDIYLKIKKLVNMHFDEEYLYSYSKQHDYLQQNNFLNFLDKKINE